MPATVQQWFETLAASDLTAADTALLADCLRDLAQTRAVAQLTAAAKDLAPTATRLTLYGYSNGQGQGHIEYAEGENLSGDRLVNVLVALNERVPAPTLSLVMALAEAQLEDWERARADGNGEVWVRFSEDFDPQQTTVGPAPVWND